MKKLAAILMTILLCLSLAACGSKDKSPAKEQPAPAAEEETEMDDSEDSDLGEDTEEDDSEAPAEFEIPVQTDFAPVEGISDKYVDFENRSFAYNGKVFRLGESTLKDLIDGGIPFDEDDLNNKDNNVNSNYETTPYRVDINYYTNMSFNFINITDAPQKEVDCLLSGVTYSYTFLPQPDYEADMNADITECILDAGEKVCLSFPATLTKEQLLESNSEGAEVDEYNRVEYSIDSEVYMGNSGYDFEFDEKTGLLKRVYISWLP